MLGALGIIGLAWGLFFPVPLGWAARIAVARSLPASDPLRLEIGGATFRWRFGKPTLAVEVRGLAATQGGQPLARIPSVVVEVPKAGLWHGNFAPAQITVSEPALTLDQTRPAAPAPATAPATGPTPVAGAGVPDLAALSSVLPPAGASSRLTVNALLVHLRTAVGETNIPVAVTEVIVSRDSANRLQAEVALRLTPAAPVPLFTARATLEPGASVLGFSLTLPEFSTTALPVLPGAPLPAQGRIALDVSGRYDLAAGRLEAVTGGVIASEVDLTLPVSANTRFRIDRAEFKGRFDGRTGQAALEVGRMQAGKFSLVVNAFTADVGPQPQANWDIELTGLESGLVLSLLPADLLKALPVTPEALATVALNRAAVRGNGKGVRDASGNLKAAGLQAEGRLEFGLGGEPFQVNWTARQSDATSPITVTLDVPSFVPARWPAALLAGTPAGVVDVPISLKADVALSSAGDLRAAHLALTGSAGTLRPLQPGLPSLAVRQIDLQVASEQTDRVWLLPRALLELQDGTQLELTGTRADLTPDRLKVQGEAAARGLSGGFLALWLPPGTWAPLESAGLPPAKVSITSVAARFDATAVKKKDAWEAETVTASANTRLRVGETTLTITARLTQPQASADLEAVLDVASFNPADLGLILAPDLTSRAFDFPLTIHAVAKASAKGNLTTASLQLRAGPGRVTTPAPVSATLPLQVLNVDAVYDAARQGVTVQDLRVEVGDLKFNVRDVAANLAAPYVANGRLDLDAFALKRVLPLWPETQQPALRSQVTTALQAGEFRGGSFNWAVKYDPAAKEALVISRLQGRVQLSGVEATVPGIPDKVSVADLTTSLDYPVATVELRDITLPGAKVSQASLQVTALNTAAPAMGLTAKLSADLAEASRIWQLAPAGVLTGQTTGTLSLQAPLTGDALDARLVLDLAGMKLALTGFPNAAPSALNLSAQLAHLATKGVAPTVDFRLEAPKWLDQPLLVAGRAALTETDYSPTAIDLTAFEHGRTRLQAKWTQPVANRMDVTLTGSRLDAGPLLRAALAAADAMPAPTPVASVAAPAPARPVAAVPAAGAARPASATAPAPARPPEALAVVAAVAKPAAPDIINVSVKVDEVEFGTGQSVRGFNLQGHLEDNWPSSLALQAEAGAGNLLKVDFTGAKSADTLKLAINDASGWVRAMTAPWDGISAGSGQYGTIVEQMKKVPAIIAGGTVVAEAQLHREQADWLTGNLKLTRAGMVRAPRIVQLLALKSGKALQRSPLLESFTIGKLTLGETQARVEDIALVGAGFLSNLKVKSAIYQLANEAIKVDGEYFGVGFDVVGTRADPQIFLKDDNKLIRTIGTRNEFDFFNDLPEPATPAKK